jgi:threonine/homoserine/homoserine lactone efflux protein
MTPEEALGFLGFSIVVAGTPGPSNAILTATGANVGVVRGLPALVGVAAGMAVLMFVVVFGLGEIILKTSVLLTAVKWTGAAVLLWLAWKIATSTGTRVDKAGPASSGSSCPGAAWGSPVRTCPAAFTAHPPTRHVAQSGRSLDGTSFPLPRV